MNNKSFMVTKASGEREIFSLEKYRRSLRRSGLNDQEIDEVLSGVQGSLNGPITTRDLYGKTFEILRGKNPLSASKYSLKEALRLLGPTGFPFEYLIAAVLMREGFAVKVGQVVSGTCVDHEIDVLAKNDKEYFLVECKFHNGAGIKTDVQTTLYLKARFDDLIAGGEINFTRIMLATNTKFTQEATRYGTCINMRLLSWGYPEGNGLEKLIEQHKLYPITALTSLKKGEKQLLLQEGLVTCQDILENMNRLTSLRISKSVLTLLQEECRSLLR